MSGLAKLTAQYTDSENEDVEQDDGSSPTYKKPDILSRDMQRVLNAPPVTQLKLKNVHSRVEITPNGSTGPLVAYDGHDSDEVDEDVPIEDDELPMKDADLSFEVIPPEAVDMEIESQSSSQASETQESIRVESPRSFHRRLLAIGKGAPVQLPPEPSGKCSDELQSMISDYCSKTDRGMDLVGSIQRKKAFRNPSIYEKLLLHCDIDELGSNFPSEIFDPHIFQKEDFYEELGRKQNELMEKEKKKKSEPVQTIGSVTSSHLNSAPAVKKSKWDQGAQAGTIPRNVAAPGLVSIPTGTKPVVISGMGSLPKPKNPVTHVGTSAASRR